jgi:hypothetical protein
VSVNAGIDQFNALAGTLLSKGRVSGGSLGAGAVSNLEASVGASDFITVEGDLGPTASAAGDLTVQVFPYSPDGSTLMGTPLTPVAGIGYAGTLVAAHSQLVQRFDVMGIDKVRVVFKNNNAGALPFTGGWSEL